MHKHTHKHTHKDTHTHTHTHQVRRLVLLASAGLPCHVPLALSLLHVPVLGELLWTFLARKIVCKPPVWTTPTHQHSPAQREFVGRLAVLLNTHSGYARSLLRTLQQFPMFAATRTFQEIARHPRPVLLLWGDEDSTCPVHIATSLKALFGERALLRVLPGLEHNFVLDAPEVVNPEVVQFLARSTV